MLEKDYETKKKQQQIKVQYRCLLLEKDYETQKKNSSCESKIFKAVLCNHKMIIKISLSSGIPFPLSATDIITCPAFSSTLTSIFGFS